MKKAFTTVELIIIITIIGILSAIATSAFRDDNLALAAHQTLNHIRYTQHLAMSEHKFDPKDSEYAVQDGADGTKKGFWFSSRWQIWFFNSGGDMCYAVYSDKDREGNCDINGHMEAAIDPATSKAMIFNTNGGNNQAINNPDFDLTTKYGITNIGTQNCNQANGNPTRAQLVFDEKGRPYGGTSAINTTDAYLFRLTQNCTITLTGSDARTAIITVHPETGYAEITSIN